MIRATQPGDTQQLLALAAGTAVFKSSELEALEEVLCDFFGTNKALGHKSVTFDEAGQALGFAYYAPAAMTDRTWYLYWIAVNTRVQVRGIGSTLLEFAEAEIRQQHGRLLLIETSSLPQYDPARRFYAKHGYRQAAQIADYYADDDSMVVFSKRLATPDA